jgi:hypothetical protein
VEEAAQPKSKEQICAEKLLEESREARKVFMSRIATRLNETVGNWYFDPGRDLTSAESLENMKTKPWRKERSPAGKFVQALAKSGFLDDPVEDFRGELAESSLSLLDEVAAADPKNSAPLIFALALAKRQGLKDRVDELEVRLRYTDHFDAYFEQLIDPIYDSVSSPSDLWIAHETVANLPHINPTQLASILSENEQYRVAEQIYNNSRGSEAIPGLDFSMRQYFGAYGALKKLGHADGVPSPQELFDKAGDRGDLFLIDIDNVIAERCDLNDLDPSVRKLQEHLAKRRSR